MPLDTICAWTEESLFDGRVVIRQAQAGYRFSLDAVLLAGLTRCGKTERVLDLGTGCGVVPLVMCYRGQGKEWVGLEIQMQLVELARQNIAANGFDDRIRIEPVDFREIPTDCLGSGYDLVVSNPPYRGLGAGRTCPDPQRAMARHELTAELEDVFNAAHHLLKLKGRLALVYPAQRLQHLIRTAGCLGFGVKRLTPIYTKPARPARLVHVECVKGGGQVLDVEPPFFVHNDAGGYSPAMQRLYAG